MKNGGVMRLVRIAHEKLLKKIVGVIVNYATVRNHEKTSLLFRFQILLFCIYSNIS